MNTDNGALEFDAYINNERLRSSATEAERRIKGVSDSAIKDGQRMENSFSGAGKALALIGGTAALGMLGKQILDTTAKFEKFGIVLRNTLGDTQGNDALTMIADFAATTPFQLDEVTGAFIKMANQGFVPTKNELVKLGDLASSTGKGFDMLAEAILDAQTGEFERLKEFGIKASSNGDKVTFSFKEQQTTVDKTNSAIRDYILSLGELNGIQGANEKISQSMSGKISNLQDKFAAMFNEIGTSNSGVIYSALDGVSSLVEHYGDILDVLLPIVATYGAYKAAVIATVAAQKASAALTFAKEYLVMGRNLGFATANQIAFNKATLANPYAIAIAAVVGLSIAIYKMSNNMTAAEEAQKRLDDAMEEAKSKISDETSKVTSLVSVINDENNSREYRNKKLKELISISPEHLNNLTLENIKTNEGKTAIDAYVESLDKKIRIQTLEAELTSSIKRKQDAESGKDNTSWVDVAMSSVASMGSMSRFGTSLASKNANKNADIISAEKEFQEKIKAQIAAITSSGSDKKIVDTIINEEYWEKQVKEATEAIKKLDTKSKTYNADRKKQIDLIRQGESEIAKIMDFKNDKKNATAQEKIEQKEASEYDKYVKELLEKTRNYEEKKTAIQISYEMDRQDKNVAGNQSRIDELNRQEKKELDALEADNILKSDSYKWLFDKIEIMGRESLQNYISRLGKEIEAHKDNDEFKLELSKKLSEAEQTLAAKAPAAAIKVLNASMVKLKADIAQAKTKIDKDKIKAELANKESEKGQLIAKQFQNTADILSSMGDLAGTFDSNLSKSLKTAAQLGTGLASAIGAFSGGNIIGGITASIGVLTSIIKLFKKDEGPSATENLEKWISNLQKIISLQKESLDLMSHMEQVGGYSALLAVVDSQLVAVEKRMQATYKTTQDMIAKSFKDYGNGIVANSIEGTLGEIIKNKEEMKYLLNKSFDDLTQEDWNKMLANTGGDLNKQLGDLYTQWVELQKQQKDYINAQNELLTGSTYDSIVSSIVDGFADGYDSAADFANSFEELMRKALIQSLQVQYLEKPLQDWYNQFAAANENGLTAQEIEALKAAYNSIITGANNYATSLEVATGITLGNADSTKENALSGAIKGMSEETASVLSGQTNAIRINQLESINVLRQQLSTLNQISTNTSNLSQMKDVVDQLRLLNQALSSRSQGF